MLPKRKKISLKTVVFAITMALLIHVQLIFTDLLPAMYRFWSSLIPKPKPPEVTEVTMVSLPQRDWEDNRQVKQKLEVKEEEAERKLLAEEEKKEEEKDKDLKGQIVELAPTPDSSRPKDARFLSEYNTNVEKESVSRHQRKDYGVAQPRPTIAEHQMKKPDQPPEEEGKHKIALFTRKQGQRDAATKSEQFAFELPDIKKRQSLKLKLDLDVGAMPTYEASDQVRGNSDRMRLQFGKKKAEEGAEGEEGEDEKSVAMLGRPAMEYMDMVTGAPPNDYIRDVPKGESTLLNSREFKYATFFHRVRRGVSDHWNPGEVYLRRDPYGNIYGVKDRYTVLNVVLDQKGELTDVSVVRSSGIGFLDDEAVSAFKGASPFPNPPEGLQEADGNIRFQFGFYFEIGERPKIRGFQFRPY